MTYLSPKPSRRAFLAGGAGLVIAATLPIKGARGLEKTVPLAPNAFVRVGEDDLVTVVVKHIELGQGAMTGLATLVADELDADWGQIRAEHAPANQALYGTPPIGSQGVGGSRGLRSSWDLMRRAGAQARAVLVQAAAEGWDVPAAEITIEEGRIRHAPSGREDGFGAFAAAASKLDVPADPPLKTPAQWVFIGKDNLPRLDSREKSSGTAQFTIDLFRDGMLHVALLKPPAFKARLVSLDDGAALAVPGVRHVAEITGAVAVYADNSFAAFKGRDALVAEWDMAEAETRSSEEIEADMRARAESGPGKIAIEEGSVEQALAESERVVEAEYAFPFLCHTPMEPLGAVVEWTEDGAEAWIGCQNQTRDQETLARELGFDDPMKVRLNTMLAGGSFGRRSQHDSHVAREAAQALMASPDRRPVKLLYSREDDVRGGYYRPLVVHRLRAGLNPEGEITAWEQRIASPSIVLGTPFESFMEQMGGVDFTITEGATHMPYAVPHFRVGVHQVRFKVPMLWWRSVGHTHTAFAMEAMMDELFAAAGKDPVQGRLALMGEEPRGAAVLERAAEMAGYGRTLAEGHAFGVAYHKSFSSYVAQIAEVSLEFEAPRVHKIWCAIDCGVPVNPDIVRSQMEGGIGFGVSSALYEAIHLDAGGSVRESNWDAYRVLRIDEMPDIEVAIIDSSESPMGVGEPGTPPTAPAIANAVRQLTGKPIRRLPMTGPFA